MKSFSGLLEPTLGLHGEVAAAITSWLGDWECHCGVWSAIVGCGVPLWGHLATAGVEYNFWV